MGKKEIYCMSKKIKILMVDDEKQFRSTTQKILNRRGFDTILAGTGEEALEKLDEKPDVVVLDVKMPGMDGHQTLREIKKQVPDLPVIMLTGHGNKPSARDALVAGAFDYLSKPCDLDLLTMKINDACAHGRTGGQPVKEKNVAGVMIPISDYTTISRTSTILDAIFKLKDSFVPKMPTSQILETGHRSLIIMDEKRRIEGVVAITDLLEAILPAYLSAPKPSMADGLVYSPMFWNGMFSREVNALANKKIEEVMSEAPMTVALDASLMEVAYLMVKNNQRRLVVMDDQTVAGVVREQDLFFEIEKILT